jgi:hypothetical protein
LVGGIIAKHNRDSNGIPSLSRLPSADIAGKVAVSTPQKRANRPADANVRLLGMV